MMASLKVVANMYFPFNFSRIIIQTAQEVVPQVTLKYVT